MDPITVAILAALGKVGASAVDDAYQGLKSLIRRKLGGESAVAESIDRLEAKPDSAGRREVLREELAAAGADRDPELLQAAQRLLGALREAPGGQQIIQQTVTGDQNAFSATGDVTVSFGRDEG